MVLIPYSVLFDVNPAAVNIPDINPQEDWMAYDNGDVMTYNNGDLMEYS